MNLENEVCSFSECPRFEGCKDIGFKPLFVKDSKDYKQCIRLAAIEDQGKKDSKYFEATR